MSSLRTAAVWLKLETKGTTLAFGNFNFEDEKSVHLHGQEEPSPAMISLTFPFLPAVELKWESIDFLNPLKESTASVKIDFSSIPAAILQDSRYEESISQGQLYSIHFHLAYVKVKGDLAPQVDMQATSTYCEALLQLCLYPRQSSLVVYVEGVGKNAPDTDMINWLKIYKKRYGASMEIYQSTKGIPIELGRTKPLHESPNTSLGRSTKFKSLMDYVVFGLMYPAVREREFLENAFNREQITASMELKVAQSRSCKNHQTQVFHFQHFPPKCNKHVHRVTGIGDKFDVKLNNHGPVLLCKRVPCYHTKAITGLAGMVVHANRQLGRSMQTKLEARQFSTILNTQLAMLQQFRITLDDQIYSSAKVGLLFKARWLEQLLLANQFCHSVDHHLFDELTMSSTILAGLSADQRKAFEHVRHVNDLFAFVHAPAGTDESGFILNMISMLVSVGKRILVVSPTDFWANTIATQIDLESVVRCFNLVEEITGCPNGYWEKTDSPSGYLDPKEELHHKALSKSLRAMLSNRLKKDISFLTDHLARIKAAVELLNNTRVIITTCAVASTTFLQQHFKPDAVFIGQATYAHEIQLFPVLFGFLESTKLFLFVGDEAQMAPVVISRAEKDDHRLWRNPFAVQLGVSLMERMRLAGYPCVWLTENVRMVSQMGRVTWDVFYPKVSITDHSIVSLSNREWARLAPEYFQNQLGMGIQAPAIILNVPTGVCVQDKDSDEEASRFNLHNLVATMKFLDTFMTATKWPAKKVTILTPYMSQVTKYNEAMSLYPEFPYVDVRTIDSFQSGEGSMIILDAVIATVRDGGPGFLTEHRRLNIATSCARDCFVLVIDMGILKELQGDLRSVHSVLYHQERIEKDPRYLRDFLSHYERSSSVHTFPIGADDLPAMEHMDQLRSQQTDHAARECNKCKSKGHVAQDCTEPDKEITCYFCKNKGHFASDCPVGANSYDKNGKLDMKIIKAPQTLNAYKIEKITRID